MKASNWRIKKIGLAAVMFAVTVIPFKGQSQQRTNAVLILVDDMGYSDIETYGAEIYTPNIDQLAMDGIRLRQFYNNAIGAPTRATLLTGQYPHKAGYLNKESLTLAGVFCNADYNTYTVGKWHVGRDSSGQQRPTQRGFCHFFNFLSGASACRCYQTPLDGFNESGPFYEDNKPISFRDEKDFYLTDKIADYATRYIDAASASDKPFFLYVAFNAPRWPLKVVSIVPVLTGEKKAIEDREETNNLTTAYSDIVETYDLLYRQWAKGMDVVEFEILKVRLTHPSKTHLTKFN